MTDTLNIDDAKNPSGSLEIVRLEDEMRKSYLDYAMSVIVSRALPDVRDGLKPVHRRILYGMYQDGVVYNKTHRKSASIIGEVIRKFHPHGNEAVYEAMVRMAQDFSMRMPLVDGQGNFGSMDGDPPAAMRYTEARLSQLSHFLLEDIYKETVDFQPNYDETHKEPLVLPARFPNLLVNGAGGIAVGMATNIPPHNLGEVVTACLAYLENPAITFEELLEIIPGPDFPTGALIIGRRGIVEAYKTGRGSVIMRARTAIEEVRKDRNAIIVTEVPFQVNKARMLEKIAELVNAKTVEGISDLRDESDRHGVRVVIELKKDADPNVVLNQLYKYSSLQTSFGCNMLALDGGRPLTMGIYDIISAFMRFREEVIVKRTKHNLRKAKERAHVYLGLAVAVANIDEIIAIIRKSVDSKEAKEKLMGRIWPAETVVPLIKLIHHLKEVENTYQLSEVQAQAILDLRLHRLTGLERDKIAQELENLAEEIKGYLIILNDRAELVKIIREELEEVREKFVSPRRTEIVDVEVYQDIEELIQKEDMVVTVTHGGYIKRVPLSSYRSQKRGGKGKTGMVTRDEDFVHQIFVANTHTQMLFFTNKGMVYDLKVYKIPLASAQSKGRAIINLLPLGQNEQVTAIMAVPTDDPQSEKLQIVFATEQGNVRRNELSDFLNIRANGKIAMKLDGNDTLIGVQACHANQDVLLATQKGFSVRFHINAIRIFSGRNSTGVKGIKLKPDDKVVSMSLLTHYDFTVEERNEYLRYERSKGEEPLNLLSQDRYHDLKEKEEFLLTISRKGFGKRSSCYEYRLSNRATQGISCMEITEKTGDLVNCQPIESMYELVLITDGGQLIRSSLSDVRISGRKTQGVRLFRVSDAENVVSCAVLKDLIADEQEEEALDQQGVVEN